MSCSASHCWPAPGRSRHAENTLWTDPHVAGTRAAPSLLAEACHHPASRSAPAATGMRFLDWISDACAQRIHWFAELSRVPGSWRYCVRYSMQSSSAFERDVVQRNVVHVGPSSSA